jgi:hypothetical protein
MKTYALLLCLALIGTRSSAQTDFRTDYKPLQSQGRLPTDFTTLSSDKYAEDKAVLKSEKGKVKKVKDQFLLESNFEIDGMLLSGKVLFNDPMSQYVNKVADKVLANDKETRSKLRFYILKSPSVNAFATNQGIIFVNMGLLAQLEDESQLAYVLSHEIIHYQKKHSINRAVQAEKIQNGKDSYKTFTKDEKYIATCSFTKEQESEADEKGFDLFKNTNYSTSTLLGVFDVLKYSYLPFDDVTFDKSFLENASYKLPKSLIVTETAPINTKDDEDNPKSTHPSIKARRFVIADKIGNTDNKGKANYLVSKENFEEMREAARFELSRLYLLRHEYESAIYNSYMLLKKYPDNIYLKKNVMEALVGISTYAQRGDFVQVHVAAREVEGKSQTLNYILEKMDSVKTEDIAIMAFAYTAKLKKQYPKDVDIDEQAKFMIGQLVRSEIDMDYFSNTTPPAGVLAGDTQKAVATDTAANKPAEPAVETPVKMVIIDDNNTGSKYDKIKKQENTKQQEVKEGKGYYAQYAIVDYYNEPWVKEYFVEAEKTKDEKKSEELVMGKHSTVSNKVYELGIEKVLVINPYYAKIDGNVSKKKNTTKYLQSEDGQIDFSERLKLNAKKAKLDMEILDSKKLSDSEVEKMNDITELENYISERLEVPSDVQMLYPERERIEMLARKYNTDYFLWTGVVSYDEFRRSKVGLAVMSAVMPFMLPFTLSSLINRGHYTYYFNMMYDVKNDRVKMVNFRQVNCHTGPGILNSHIFDTFEQIRSEPSQSAENKTEGK